MALPPEPGAKMIRMAAPKAGSAPAPGGGGGYKFSPEQLEEAIRQWKQLADDLEADQKQAEAMAAVKAPGKEFASGDFQKQANPSGKAFLKQNKKMQQYVNDYIEALEAAKTKTENTEDDMQAQMNKAGAEQA